MRKYGVTEVQTKVNLKGREDEMVRLKISTNSQVRLEGVTLKGSVGNLLCPLPKRQEDTMKLIISRREKPNFDEDTEGSDI